MFLRVTKIICYVVFFSYMYWAPVVAFVVAAMVLDVLEVAAAGVLHPFAFLLECPRNL